MPQDKKTYNKKQENDKVEANEKNNKNLQLKKTKGPQQHLQQ